MEEKSWCLTWPSVDEYVPAEACCVSASNEKKCRKLVMHKAQKKVFQSSGGVARTNIAPQHAVKIYR